MTLLSLAAARVMRLPARRSGDVRVEADIPVPMRDGVALLADRWFANGLDAGPIVLMRSPYGRSGSFGMIARFFAERGFQLVLQSCRGTAGSGGKFDPMRQEEDDGLDTLNWIRAQPWFTGRLYTFGGSYLGFTQWALAKTGWDRIDGMALQVTLSNFRNETLAFGGFTLEGSLQWTTFMNARSARGPIWARLLRRPSAELAKIHAHLPLQELDSLAIGKEVSWWQDWVGHGDPSDPWWMKIDHSASVGDVDVPAAMVGGWRDIFLPWQVKDFEAMQARGRKAWLTIGPWGHTSMGGSSEALRQALALFDAHSRGRRPFPDRDRVRLYVKGVEKWRDYSSWPPPGSRETRIFLHSEGKLRSTPPISSQSSSAFVYDPKDPTPSLHGPQLMGGSKKPNMEALEKRSDTISFTSEPLSSGLEAIGPVAADLHIRSERQHTDFYACLCEVDHAGKALHVVDGYLRLRPGDVPEDTSGVRRIRIECWPTAHCFKKGSRLRLIIASGAHPRYARNLGTGEPLGTGTQMVAARQEIFHDQARPSALCLTVMERLG